jgi:hypothetical protein
VHHVGAFLPVLSEGALDSIQDSAYRLLAEVGVSLQHKVATEMLHGRGCRIEKARVLIPPDTVRWALGHVTPHRVHLNRDGSQASALSDGQVRSHSGGGLAFVYVGNVSSVADGAHRLEHTYCPGCGSLLVERWGLRMAACHLDQGRCPVCGRTVPGVWGPSSPSPHA